MGVAGSDGSDGSDGGWRVFLSHTSELRNFPEKGSQASGSGGRELDEDTLARRRRVLGEDHPDTLLSANNLAADLHNLGEYQAARELDEDTLARYRRVLGEDHPDTLRSANNLAADLRALSEADDDP